MFFRSLFALPILLLVAQADLRGPGRMSRRTVALSALAGVFFAIDLTAFHVAVDLVGAGVATMIANQQVVIIAFAAWLFLGERPRREVFVALPILLAGLVLMSGAVGDDAYGRDPRAGALFAIVSALGYSGYLLVIRGASPTHRPAGPVAVAAASMCLVGGAFALATGTLELRPVWPTIGFLAAYGLVSQAIGYVAIQSALPRLPAVIGSVLLLVQPVSTLVLGIVLLGEDPSLAQLLGVVLILGGIALATGALRRVAEASGLGRRPASA